MKKYVPYIFFFLFILINLPFYAQIEPPALIPESVTENYFTKEIKDQYRNIENLQDSLVKFWYEDESKYANAILENITGTDSLMKRMKEDNNRKSFFVKMTKVTENDRYFYLKKLKQETTYKLFYRNAYNGEEQLIYNPEDFKPTSGNIYSINYIKPNWEGNYVVVSLSHSGKELSELIIIDIKNNKVLPQVIDKAWPSSFLGISWLPDSSGFIYLQFPITDSEDSNFKKNTQSVLYKLGDDPEEYKILINASLFPNLELNPNEYPIVSIKSKNDPYFLAYIASVDNFWDVYYVKTEDLDNSAISWKPFYKKEDMVFTNNGIFNEAKYTYKSSLHSPNFQIASVNIEHPDFKNPMIIVPEKVDEVIDEFEITSNGLYFTTSKNGVEAKLYRNEKSVSKRIELPKKAGNIGLSSKGPSSEKLWVNLNGWVNSDERYSYSLKDNKFNEEELAPKATYPEFEDFIVEEISIPSHDGIMIPLSIIRSSKTQKNSKNPILFYGYGAYGDALNPFFSPLFLTWIENGGILCITHVRGGGEKGETWRKAGYKVTKPNTWKDFIACAEYMIENNFTSKEHTVAYSSSAGGIMVGMAIIERPDLFAAVIVDAGVMNPLRRESTSGGSNFREYGTIKDSTECMALIAMDPYINLKKGVNYPAGLFITGMNDPRVPPWMTGKFVAKIQKYSTSKKPILYKIEYDGGHGSGSSPDDVYKKWAEMFSFALWQTGHPDYQPKK